jgi:hypothetical protein
MPNITNITPPRVPLLDPRNGLISREWYLFFLSLFNQTGGSAVSLEDVQKGPPSQDVDLTGLLAQASLNAESSSALLSQYAALSNEVQALSLGPADTPQLPRLRYGSFYDTTDQTAAVINTAYGMTFNSTDLSQGVYLGSPTSRVYVDTHNVYNIQFSAQLVNTAGGTHNTWIWLRKNGTDVANSATTLRLQGNNAEEVAAWNFLLDMNAGDYFELMWEVSNLAVSLLADPASAVHPAIPSIILTVTDNISS